MKPSDLVEIDLQGASIGSGTPSSEIKLHLAIYRERADCVSVIHAHPPTALAFALVGETIPDDLLPEAAFVLGSVALAPFGKPGTEEVGDRMLPLMHDHKTILMSHHGAVTMGRSIEDAYNRMETLERVATVIFRARQLGTPVPMPETMFDHIVKNALHGRL